MRILKIYWGVYDPKGGSPYNKDPNKVPLILLFVPETTNCLRTPPPPPPQKKKKNKKLFLTRVV